MISAGEIERTKTKTTLTQCLPALKCGVHKSCKAANLRNGWAENSTKNTCYNGLHYLRIFFHVRGKISSSAITVSVALTTYGKVLPGTHYTVLFNTTFNVNGSSAVDNTLKDTILGVHYRWIRISLEIRTQLMYIAIYISVTVSNITANVRQLTKTMVQSNTTWYRLPFHIVTTRVKEK